MAEEGRGAGGKGMALGRVALTAQAELARFQTPTIQRDASRQSAIHERVTRVATRLHVCCGAEGLCDVAVACDGGRAPAWPGAVHTVRVGRVGRTPMGDRK